MAISPGCEPYTLADLEGSVEEARMIAAKIFLLIRKSRLLSSSMISPPGVRGGLMKLGASPGGFRSHFHSEGISSLKNKIVRRLAKIDI